MGLEEELARDSERRRWVVGMGSLSTLGTNGNDSKYVIYFLWTLLKIIKLKRPFTLDYTNVVYISVLVLCAPPAVTTIQRSYCF